MTASRSVVELPAQSLPQLSAAIAKLLPDDRALLVSLLELGYLAASADGLDEAERTALADILAKATGKAIDVPTFRAHFEDLDSAVSMLGRRERLARTSADFTTEESQTTAIKFAALVSMADGQLHEHELVVLTEAASFFDWNADRVKSLVEELPKSLGGTS